MVPVLSLWLPIVLSAVAVFIVSAILHMVLRYHTTDYAQLPNEDAIRDALHQHNIPPGNYMTPWGAGPEAMKDPGWLAKYERGPVAHMTVMRAGKPSMSAELLQWFIFLLAVSIFAAYIAGRALTTGADYLDVFRFAGGAAFGAYVFGGWQETIWYKRKFSTSLKNSFDGLIYTLVTAGMFGWLWPS
jgi:hypothetical protein